MRIQELLTTAIQSGKEQIGEIIFLQTSVGYQLFHYKDKSHLENKDKTSLTRYTNPLDAIELSKYDKDGNFRFTKGELSLKTGWCFELTHMEQVVRTLEFFYGAALALWIAHEQDTLRVQNLREKLARQTGMYRYSRSISDEGAQHLVNTLCGPENKCVKKILWSISENKLLEDNAVSQFPGRLDTENKCVPMLCQEACNFFVAKARIQAKKEFEQK